MAAELEARLWAKVDRRSDAECWPWLGPLRNGYGVINFGAAPRRSTGVHRLAYETAHGPIAAGLVIDHLCRNRRCCKATEIELTIAGPDPEANPQRELETEAGKR